MADIKVKKKNITLGNVYIKVTFNNTIVTFTDAQGNAISWSSAGAQGFKGAKKATPYAGQLTVERAAGLAKYHGIRTVQVFIDGPGPQRESVLRAILSSGFVVMSITDVSPIPHNGTRAPKKRKT